MCLWFRAVSSLQGGAPSNPLLGRGQHFRLLKANVFSRTKLNPGTLIMQHSLPTGPRRLFFLRRSSRRSRSRDRLSLNKPHMRACLAVELGVLFQQALPLSLKHVIPRHGLLLRQWECRQAEGFGLLLGAGGTARPNHLRPAVSGRVSGGSNCGSRGLRLLGGGRAVGGRGARLEVGARRHELGGREVWPRGMVLSTKYSTSSRACQAQRVRVIRCRKD